MGKKDSNGIVRLRLRAGLMGGFALAGIALGAFPRLTGFEQSARKSTENPVASRGKLVQELFLAIDHRDTKSVDELLKQGADPNSRNGLDFTPIFIAAASHQPDVVDLLLKAGAKPDAPSIYGTPLTFAAATANLPDAKRFLSLGAKPDFQRNDGLTPLMMAANSGSPDFVSELLSHKVDVNLQDDGGQTALHFAALQGWTDAGKVLLNGGAKVDLADEEGHTPLMAAAINGHADFVQALIDKGADVNAKDSAGRTAAILAASYADNPEVIKVLQAAKADFSIKDNAGRTAAEIAHMRGFTQSAALLGAPVEAAPEPSRSVDDAVNRSLKLIAANTRQFEESATCISCHHEGLGRMATGEAKMRGFKVDEGVQQATMGRINGMVVGIRPLVEQALQSPEAMKHLPLIEINEVTPMASWIMAGMASQNQAPTAASAALALTLGRQQSPAGCWTFSLPRVPMQSSFFTFTALSAKALATYGPKASSAEIAERLGNAKKWFLEAKPQSSEDRASRLLGLKWSGGTMDDRKAAVADIVADQKPDGGWSQTPNGPSDAYATGQALYALRVGGSMPASDPVYQKGVRFLLLTQDDDGSWYTGKRALPVNNYLDAGFPHGESQYASFNATCWATLGLLGDAKAK